MKSLVFVKQWFYNPSGTLNTLAKQQLQSDKRLDSTTDYFESTNSNKTWSFKISVYFDITLIVIKI